VDFRWQVPFDVLLTHVANVPSRIDMRRPRADLADNLWRTYSALWRHARATHSAIIDTTWEQLFVACGYEPKALAGGPTSLQRYVSLLQEAGLVLARGVTKPNGQWSHLQVQLVEPPSLLSESRRRSSAGEATFWVCSARREREDASQRAERRRQPWRRAGGRRDAHARHILSWSCKVANPPQETGYPPQGGSSQSFSHVHATRAARGCDAPPAATGAVDDQASRKERRRERRRQARIERWQSQAAAERWADAEERRRERRRQARIERWQSQAAAEHITPDDERTDDRCGTSSLPATPATAPGRCGSSATPPAGTSPSGSAAPTPTSRPAPPPSLTPTRPSSSPPRCSAPPPSAPRSGQPMRPDRPQCRHCAGTGLVETTATASRRPVRVACPECRGAGETGPLPAWSPDCQRCAGSGVVQVGTFRDKPVTMGCPQCNP
jgi:hypothetical protein